MKRATAYANANIALVKYWGKNDSEFNVPAVPSLSMTLNDLGTTVTVTASSTKEHALLINGHEAPALAQHRLGHFFGLVNKLYPSDGFFKISSASTIPYAAGLASSASFFAALSLALSNFLELGLDNKELSKLARIGSASAARSIFCGFAALNGGMAIDHDGAFAFPLNVHPELDAVMLIAMINTAAKGVSSRDAMNHTQRTSPFFHALVETQEQDFNDVIRALENGCFEQLGIIMEQSTLKMFATMWTAQPAINYWHPGTISLLNFIYQLRQKYGPHAYFTMDAGPNVKILCRRTYLPILISELQCCELGIQFVTTEPGKGAFRLDTHLS